MGDCARAWAIVTLAASIGVACGESAATATLTVVRPAGLDFGSAELIVYDEGARCIGTEVAGGTEIDRIAISIGETLTVAVDPGDVAFALVAFDGDAEVARGCSSESLQAGDHREVDIDLVDVSCFGEPAELIEFGAVHAGDTRGGKENMDGCETRGGPERYYRMFLDRGAAPAQLVITTDLEGTISDTVVRVRTTCDERASELLCFDGPTGPDTTSVMARDGGVYYVIVDSTTAPGPFELQVIALIDRQGE